MKQKQRKALPLYDMYLYIRKLILACTTKQVGTGKPLLMNLTILTNVGMVFCSLQFYKQDSIDADPDL